MTKESRFFHSGIGKLKQTAKAEASIQSNESAKLLVSSLREQVYESIKVMGNKLDDKFNDIQRELDIVSRDYEQARERFKLLDEELQAAKSRLETTWMIGGILFVSVLLAAIFWR